MVKVLSLFISLLLSASAFAGSMVFQGVLEDTSSVPLAGVTFNLLVEIRPPSSGCALASQSFASVTTDASGKFVVVLSPSSFSAGISSLEDAFDNSKSSSGACVYTPTANASRDIVAVASGGTLTGGNITLTMNVGATPFSVTSKMSENTRALQGYSIGNIAPNSGEVLKFNGSSWVPSADLSGAGTPASISSLGAVIVPTASGLTVDGAGNLGLNLDTNMQLVSNKLSVKSTALSFDANQITAGSLLPVRGGTGLTALGTSNQILGINNAGTAMEYKSITAGTGISVVHGANSVTINATGSGTVTSVGLTVPSYMSSSTTTAVTTAGAFNLSFDNQANNLVFAGPNTGGPLAPSFRMLRISDIRANSGGNPSFLGSASSCAAGEALTYSSITDQISCSVISMSVSNSATLNAGKIWVGDATNKAQEVNLSGDVAAVSNTGAVTLANSGVVASTYRSVTVDAKGRVTAGTNPTTLAGYGITDAVPTAGGSMTGALQMNASNEVRFADADSSNYISFKAPATVSANIAWTLPAADGTSGQVLSTNGSGVLSWATAGGGGISGGGTTGYLPKFSTATALTDSLLYETGNDLMTAGNYALPTSTASAGQIKIAGTRFMHAYGTDNTFLGAASGNTTMTGTGRNVAIGKGAFPISTTGNNNVAIGYSSTVSLSSGNNNVAIGSNSGANITTGSNNTVVGYNANANSVSSAVAIGSGSNASNTFQTVIGVNAAGGTGSSTVVIGYNASASAGASNSIAIGAGATVVTPNSFVLGPTGTKVGIGAVTSPASTLDFQGDLNVRGIASPGASSAGQGRIYFDSTANKFRVSENGSGYIDLVGGGSGTVTSITTGIGLLGGPITTAGALSVDVGLGPNKIPQIDSSGILNYGILASNGLGAVTGLTCSIGKILQWSGSFWACVDLKSTSLSDYAIITPTTIYVSTSGNDITGDGSMGTPYNTLQGAMNKMPRKILADTTISIQPGTYNVSNVFGTIDREFGNNAKLIIQGSGTASTYINGSPGQVGIFITSSAMSNGGAAIEISDMTIQNIPSGIAVQGIAALKNLNFYSVSSAIQTQMSSYVMLSSSINISLDSNSNSRAISAHQGSIEFEAPGVLNINMGNFTNNQRAVEVSAGGRFSVGQNGTGSATVNVYMPGSPSGYTSGLVAGQGGEIEFGSHATVTLDGANHFNNNALQISGGQASIANGAYIYINNVSNGNGLQMQQGGVLNNWGGSMTISGQSPLARLSDGSKMIISGSLFLNGSGSNSAMIEISNGSIFKFSPYSAPNNVFAAWGSAGTNRNVFSLQRGSIVEFGSSNPPYPDITVNNMDSIASVNMGSIMEVKGSHTGGTPGTLSSTKDPSSTFQNTANYWGQAAGGSSSHGLQVYNSPTSTTWMVPPGVTSIKVTVIGGGGGGCTGGGMCSTNSGGVGGVGFGYLTVTPGQNINVDVGAGGTSAPSVGNPGGYSQVSVSSPTGDIIGSGGNGATTVSSGTPGNINGNGTASGQTVHAPGLSQMYGYFGSGGMMGSGGSGFVMIEY